MLKEFKQFIAKGNAIDLAVGLIMATYFGAIVKSLVDDIIMPPIGKLIGGIDFSQLKITIQSAVVDASGKVTSPEVAIKYGSFINTLITFLIVAFAIFMVVRSYNKMKDRVSKKEEEEPVSAPTQSNEEKLLTEIRDLLKK